MTGNGFLHFHSNAVNSHFLTVPFTSLNLIPISIRFPLGYSHFQPIPTCAHSKTIKCKFKQSTGEQQKNSSTKNWTAGDVSHKPGGRLPLLSARPAVTLATLKWAANNFAAWLTEAQWVWTVSPTVSPTASRLRFEPGPYCAWVQHTNHSATEPPNCVQNVYRTWPTCVWLVVDLVLWRPSVYCDMFAFVSLILVFFITEEGCSIETPLKYTAWSETWNLR